MTEWLGGAAAAITSACDSVWPDMVRHADRRGGQTLQPPGEVHRVAKDPDRLLVRVKPIEFSASTKSVTARGFARLPNGCAATC
jgi:hypothetical protein